MCARSLTEVKQDGWDTIDVIDEGMEIASLDASAGIRTSSVPPAALLSGPRDGAHPDARRLALNVAAGGAASIAKVVMQLVMLPVMARLLGPSEFGLYAVALPLVSLFTVIADGGLGISLAREPESETDVWSMAFWATLLIGLVLCVIVIGCGSILAALLHEPRLFLILGILSSSFLFIGVSVVPVARLTRRGDLVSLSGADFLSTSVGAVAAVGLAMAGMGALSLAVQYVVGYAMRAAILNRLAFERPRKVWKPSALRHHVAAGSALVTGRLFDFFCRLSENLLFGRLFGAAALGTYTFANQVPRFLCEAASNPVWSALYAQIVRSNIKSTAATYRNLSRVMATVTFPVAALLSAAAPGIIPQVLGDKWSTAGHLMQILVPGYAAAAVASMGSAILLATGRNGLFLGTFAGLSAGRVVAILVGSMSGPTAVAWSLDGVSFVYAMVMIVTVTRTLEMDRGAFLRELGAPAAAAVLAGMACAGMTILLPAGFAGSVMALIVGSGIYLGGIVLLEGPRLFADLHVLRRTVLRRA